MELITLLVVTRNLQINSLPGAIVPAKLSRTADLILSVTQYQRPTVESLYWYIPRGSMFCVNHPVYQMLASYIRTLSGLFVFVFPYQVHSYHVRGPFK